MQPFRSDLEALAARHAALEAEVEERVRARDELAHMLAEARARERDEDTAADLAASAAPRMRRAGIVMFCVWSGILAVVGVARVLERQDDRTRDLQTRRTLAQFELFSDQMCACTQKRCAEDVSSAMTRWAAKLSREMPSAPVSPDLTRKLSTVGERLTTCMLDRLMETATER